MLDISDVDPDSHSDFSDLIFKERVCFSFTKVPYGTQAMTRLASPVAGRIAKDILELHCLHPPLPPSPSWVIGGGCGRGGVRVEPFFRTCT